MSNSLGIAYVHELLTSQLSLGFQAHVLGLRPLRTVSWSRVHRFSPRLPRAGQVIIALIHVATTDVGCSRRPRLSH
jgi:hypothetical protein